MTLESTVAFVALVEMITDTAAVEKITAECRDACIAVLRLDSTPQCRPAYKTEWFVFILLIPPTLDPTHGFVVHSQRLNTKTNEDLTVVCC